MNITGFKKKKKKARDMINNELKKGRKANFKKIDEINGGIRNLNDKIKELKKNRKRRK